MQQSPGEGFEVSDGISNPAPAVTQGYPPSSSNALRDIHKLLLLLVRRQTNSSATKDRREREDWGRTWYLVAGGDQAAAVDDGPERTVKAVRSED